MFRLHKALGNAALRAYNAKLLRFYEPHLAHFRKIVGYQPSIALPRRYHEKILWRKLFDHSPLIATFCDKLATKQFITERLPQMAIPETLWIGRSILDMPSNLLSEKIVIKCNHGCDFNYFWIPGKSDISQVDSLTSQWLSKTYGQPDLEWGYTKAEKTIFAERFIEASEPSGLLDIGVRCTDGLPILASVITHNKTENMRMGYFDLEGTPIPLEPATAQPGSFGALESGFTIPRTLFSQAVEASRHLSKGLDYARYDFLTDGKKLYAGEVTVYPSSGLSKASPEGSLAGADTMINAHWDLRKSWFLSHPQRGWKNAYASLLRAALN